MRTKEYRFVGYQIPVATNFTIGTVPLGGTADTITVEVTVAGGTIDEFVLSGTVAVRDTSVTTEVQGAYVVLKNAAGTWATATTAMPLTTGNIAVLASAGTASGIFIHDVRGLDTVRFAASANTTVVTSVTVLVTVQYQGEPG